jgi:hypothetical protein
MYSLKYTNLKAEQFSVIKEGKEVFLRDPLIKLKFQVTLEGRYEEEAADAPAQYPDFVVIKSKGKVKGIELSPDEEELEEIIVDLEEENDTLLSELIDNWVKDPKNENKLSNFIADEPERERRIFPSEYF